MKIGSDIGIGDKICLDCYVNRKRALNCDENVIVNQEGRREVRMYVFFIGEF